MKYKVPFVDYPKHYHSMQGEIDTAISQVLNGGDFILRAHVRQFEADIASYVGVDYGVGVNSGTDAMLLSLLAAGIGPGDEVITVAHTFVATVAVIIHCGAKPVLVDIGEDFNMNVTQLERAITARTRAVIPVHLNGRLCDMEKLMSIASKRNLCVIEDAAQALGATFDGRKAGSFGLTGCFSFYPAKALGGIGDGGMAVTNSQGVAEKMRALRDHCVIRGTGEIVGYGYNSRLDNLQAAVLDVKFKYLPQWIERRRELASMYEAGLTGLPQVKTPPYPQPGRYFDIFTNYVLRAQRRDELVAYLIESGIEILVSWPVPMHRHPALKLGHFPLPETERVSQEVLSLPLHTELSNKQVEYVIDCIRKFYSRK
ncbi:MAG: DegT/DnrJ/EryC1/StrS family aminotransferase [Chloroflexota bacterium]|nr:DegT/DnrJ/EryC1/StrS family aminotransferase [Chloroflexota bacterium]